MADEIRQRSDTPVTAPSVDHSLLAGFALDAGGEDDVLAALSEYLGVSKDEIEEKTRRQEIVRARHLIMYLLREYGGMSFPAIGRLVGNRDHTTVIHAYNKIKAEVARNPSIERDLADLIELVGFLKERKLKVEEELRQLRERIMRESKALRIAKPRPIPERNLKILEMYREGLSLRNMAKLFDLSVERIRQVVVGTLKQIALNESIENGIELDAAVLMDEEAKKRKTLRESRKPKKQPKPAKEKRWSEYYVACKKCGTTAYPHVRHGLCERCLGQYRGQRRENIITTHSGRCDLCGISRGEAIRKYGRDFYITKSQRVLCRHHFLETTGRQLGNRPRTKKVKR